MCTYFKTETEDHSIGKFFSEKKNESTGLVSEKMKALFAELNQRVEAAASRYSATGELNNHQKITSRCLAHEYSFTYIFNDINHGYKAALLKKNYLWLLSIYMNVASYCYYEKKRRTNAHSLNIFILFQLQS